MRDMWSCESQDPSFSQFRQGERFSEGVRCAQAELCPLRGGIAIDLITRGPQAVNAVLVDISFPRQKPAPTHSVAEPSASEH